MYQLYQFYHNQIVHLVDNKYLQVRNKAYNLENEIEDGEKQYKEHVMQIIHKIQSEYYKKYGAKIWQNLPSF